jgi:hypothetical protein
MNAKAAKPSPTFFALFAVSAFFVDAEEAHA